MNIFFDTSSLFKLYHEEAGTDRLILFLEENPDYKIFISQLTFVEIYSALLKKVRIGHLRKSQMEKFLVVIDSDLKKVTAIPVDLSIINSAKNLVIRFGAQGLRSLDTIQLATAMSIKPKLDIALTGDILLKQCFIEEGINCDF